jgi:hypothetical protein
MHGKPTEVLAELYGPNRDTAPYRRANVGNLVPGGSRLNQSRPLPEDRA